MDWKRFWEQKASDETPLKQVGRVVQHIEMSHQALIVAAKHVVEIGEINAACSVLDVCCGNGVFTSYIRPYCGEIMGIDFSSNLLNDARSRYPDIYFNECDITSDNLPEWLSSKQFDRITLCFSFQYFESVEKGSRVVRNLLSLLKPTGKIILTDVPNQAKFFYYYNTISKLFQLIKQHVMEQNDMGKFWSEAELTAICKQLNVSGKFIKQPQQLPYSHYRFDYIITA